MNAPQITAPPLPVPATDDMRRCARCRWWSQWLPNTGDCMAYVLARREALIRVDAETYARDWPQISATCTSAFDTCNAFQEPAA